MTSPLLEVSNLEFSFEKAPLLQEVSFSIFPNEFVAIIGPNGSGKTTLLKILMGFLEPTKGRVSLFNAPPKASHLSIGYVPQVNLYDRQFPISVLDVVLMGALSKLTWKGSYPEEVLEDALKTLSLLNLKHLKNQPFGTLSGGQAQRVLIARALISHPRMIFLDEPTANIDSETQALILKLLIQLKSSTTMIMITHHLQSFIQHVDRVLCVQNTVTELKKEQICEHFTFGVFHSPLLRKNQGTSS